MLWNEFAFGYFLVANSRTAAVYACQPSFRCCNGERWSLCQIILPTEWSFRLLVVYSNSKLQFPIRHKLSLALSQNHFLWEQHLLARALRPVRICWTLAIGTDTCKAALLWLLQEIGTSLVNRLAPGCFSRVMYDFETLSLCRRISYFLTL